MRDLGRAAGLAGGAIGPPGRRSFYLQVDTEEGRSWFLLEKRQLAALAERVLEALRGMPARERVEPPEMAEPTGVSFRVGEIAIGLQGASFRVALHPGEPGEAEGVLFEVDAAAMGPMGEAALEVVVAGRPLCEFCRLPKDAGGHICPAGNGHRSGRLDA